MNILAPALALEGWLTPAEAACLYEAARTASQGIVEIGSYRGRSTVVLALGARAGQGAPLWAVDPHEHFDAGGAWRFGPQDRAALLANLARTGVAADVRLVMLDSLTVAAGWRKPLDVLFIDGDHSLKGVTADWLLWSRWLAPGGLALLHDRLEVGPAAVLADLDEAIYERLPDVDGLACLRRRV